MELIIASIVLVLACVYLWSWKEFVKWLEWIPSRLLVASEQRQLPNRVHNYQMKSSKYECSGIVPTPMEVYVETRKSGFLEQEMMFWAADSKGKLIFVQVTYLPRQSIEVSLIMRVRSFEIFSYSEKRQLHGEDCEQGKWRIDKFLLECLEPMRCWRIAFNGQLRRSSNNEGRHATVRIKFGLLWRAIKSPVDIWKDAHTLVLAKNLHQSQLSFQELRNELLEGYEQWGVLHGDMAVDNEPSDNLYLRGTRSNRWNENIRRYDLRSRTNVMAYAKGGNLASFVTEHMSNGEALTSGYVQSARGRYHPSPEICNRFAAPDSELLGKELRFKAGNKMHSFYNLREYELRDTSSKLYQKTKLFFTYNNHQWALILIRDLNWPNTSSIRTINTSIQDCGYFPLVVKLTQNRCRDSDCSGGKGSSLAILQQISSRDTGNCTFKVPKGFVVTTRAWQNHCSKNVRMKQVINEIQTKFDGPQTLEARCIRAMEEVNNSRLDSLEPIIHSMMCELFPDNRVIRFAVRSSACGEDSSESSSAGQNETVLGCMRTTDPTRPFSKIFRAVLKCWASQFSFRSVEYRRQRGKELDAGMAVVIQEMIPATESGVVFTQDPVVNDPTKVMITANYGLGQSVVDSSSEPDTITFSQTEHGLKVTYKCVGAKSIKCVMDDQLGVRSVAVEELESSRLCLSRAKALQLAKVALFVEKHYGTPRDMEFAFNKNSLYLLQARPMTAYQNMSTYEAIHELDTALLTDQEILTFGNVGEVFPGYSNPLTLSLVPKLLDLGIQRDFVQREWPSYRFDPSTIRTVAVSSNRILLNAGEMIYRGVNEKVTMTNHAVDLAIYGRPVTTPEMHAWAVDRFGIMTEGAQIIRLGYVVYDMMFNASRVRRSRGIYDSYHIPIEDVPAIDFYQTICSHLPAVAKICENHSHTSSVSTMTQCIALIVLAEGKPDVTAEIIQHIANLFSCITDTESGSVPTDLETLADAILKCPDMKEQFLDCGTEEARDWLESDQTAAGRLYKQFLIQHGHRCIKEFDLRTLSWAMEPDSLVSAIQQLVKGRQGFVKTKQKKSVQEVLSQLPNNVGMVTKLTLRVILSLCSSAVKLRESTKSMTIKTLDAFKKAYGHLGQLMTKELRLPDPDLIFFLTHYEIGTLFQTRSADLVLKASNRRRLMPSLNSQTFPEICIGVPRPIRMREERRNSENPNEKSFGTPVCCGEAVGKARVVTRLEDASTIEKGDILITYSTDVGWTPYFPLLGGVVTEIGGLISHGAVVAREYGLPCIVGVKGATQMFNSGEEIFLNGTLGFLHTTS